MDLKLQNPLDVAPFNTVEPLVSGHPSSNVDDIQVPLGEVSANGRTAVLDTF